MKKKFLMKFLRETAVICCTTFVLLEAVLRIIPSVIPPKLLFFFEPNLRSALANGRFLTEKDEVYIERTDGGGPLGIWKPHSKINYSFEDPGIVNHVTMDEVGFCNPDGTYQDSTIEIITIGDSFTFCFTVSPEDTWTKRLSGLTGKTTYNLGVIGVGIYEYLQVLEKYGLPKSPKIVIMNVYEANDLQDAIVYYDYRNSESKESAPPAGFSRVYDFLINNWAGRHSYAYDLGVSAFTFAYVKIRSKHEKEMDCRYDLVFSNEKIAFNLLNTELDEVENAHKIKAGELSFDLLDEGLKRFMELSEIHHFIPVVAYSPSAHTAYKDYTMFQDTSLAHTLEEFSLKQRKYLDQKGQELGYYYVDLTPTLQQASADYNQKHKLLYFPSNVHLTSFGHEVIAKELSKLIKKLETNSNVSISEVYQKTMG